MGKEADRARELVERIREAFVEAPIVSFSKTLGRLVETGCDELSLRQTMVLADITQSVRRLQEAIEAAKRAL